METIVIHHLNCGCGCVRNGKLNTARLPSRREFSQQPEDLKIPQPTLALAHRTGRGDHEHKPRQLQVTMLDNGSPCITSQMIWPLINNVKPHHPQG
jgi:hypothetical protein